MPDDRQLLSEKPRLYNAIDRCLKNRLWHPASIVATRQVAIRAVDVAERGALQHQQLNGLMDADHQSSTDATRRMSRQLAATRFRPRQATAYLSTYRSMTGQASHTRRDHPDLQDKAVKSLSCRHPQSAPAGRCERE